MTLRPVVEQERLLMAGTGDYVRALLDQAVAEEAFLNRLRPGKEDQPSDGTSSLSSSPTVSLMITSRQRAELRELGFPDESIRLMTPAEAHAQLGLAKPGL